MLGKSEIHIAKKCFDLNVKFSFNLIMSITLHRIYRMGVCIRIVHNSSQTPEKNEMALFSCAEILCKRKIEDATQQQPTSLCTPEATSFLLITMPAETLYNKNNKCVCSVRSGMCLDVYNIPKFKILVRCDLVIPSIYNISCGSWRRRFGSRPSRGHHRQDVQPISKVFFLFITSL
jgi:hypothetical protein